MVESLKFHRGRKTTLSREDVQHLLEQVGSSSPTMNMQQRRQRTIQLCK